MNEETILVVLMGLFLLVLFLVGIASEVVATAILPAVGRGERALDVADHEPRLPPDPIVRV